MTGLTIWTIYEKPSDYPNSYVARRFENEHPTGEHMVSPDLESLREQMRYRYLTCITRDPSDEPQIVEVWL